MKHTQITVGLGILTTIHNDYQAIASTGNSCRIASNPASHGDHAENYLNLKNLNLRTAHAMS